MSRDTSAWFFRTPSAEVESLLSNRGMSCAALFPSGGAAVGFVLSSTAHAGKLLGMKYHCDFYLCQNWERLADRLKKILWKLIDRDTYTLLRMAQNCFSKKKKKGLKMKMVSPWAGQDVDMSFLVVGWWIPCGGRQLSWDSMNNKREGSGLE